MKMRVIKFGDRKVDGRTEMFSSLREDPTISSENSTVGGISLDLLEWLKSIGIRRIRIKLKDKVLEASVEDWRGMELNISTRTLKNS
jgi:hypothetical protein